MDPLDQQLANLSPEQRQLVERWLRQSQPKELPASRPDSIPRRGALSACPMSFAQQRLWFLSQLEPDSTLYHYDPFAVRLIGPLDIVALARSLNELVRRHEILRTTFTLIEGHPRQVIADTLTLPLPIPDLQALSTAERERQAQRLAAEEGQRPLDLLHGPLIRTLLLRLEATRHVLVLNIHHIIFDGWSQGVFLQELAHLYAEFSRGVPAGLPALPIQYADFAIWQRGWLQGYNLERQLAYWKQQLAGASPLLELPSDRPRPMVQTFQGSRQTFRVSPAVSQALQALSRQAGVTLFMTLLAGFQALLARYTGQSDIVVGTPIAGRTRAELEGLIGFFVNTLVLRLDLSGNPTVREILRRVREVTLEAYAHQDLPFERLVEALEPERDLSRNPLFQVMFVLQNMPRPALELAGLTFSLLELESATAKFDLTLVLTETPLGLQGYAEYNTDLFEAATIRRMLGHYQILLAGMAAQPDQRLSDLPVLTESERQQVLVDWNETRAECPASLGVHDLFQAQADQSPDVLAVVLGDEHLTYRELSRQANHLAAHLQRLGVGPEVRVGVCLERTLEMVIAILGILKAGGAYVPLDPAHPPERLTFMLQDTTAAVLLTRRPVLEQGLQSPAGCQVICVDTEGGTMTTGTDRPHRRQTHSNQLAYVIYTSGSTGQPKGVQIEHGSLLNLVSWHQRAFAVSPQDRATQLAGLGFDAAVWEVWPYLTAGASLHLPDEETRLSPVQLQAWLVSAAITISFLPTPLAENVLALAWPEEAPLRILLTGGDRLHSYPSPRLNFDLVNNYGPTENTVVTTFGRVWPRAQADGTPSIGQPIANVQVYVLDPYLHPVPIGVAGELYIGGNSLARGYLNHPDLTAQVFIPNPFVRLKPDNGRMSPGREDTILYKTGDLVRRWPDGNLEFLGRLDHQIKIRGFRIELGEIEAALGQHPAVRETVVVVREDAAHEDATHENAAHQPGSKRLVAYLVAHTGQAPAAHELRDFLRDKLPDYMIPATFVTLAALPLTPNGKVDRRALPAPDGSRPDLKEAFVAPRTPAEKALAEIWRQVLDLKSVDGQSPIGIHDNFFELGGDSLLSLQIVSKAQQAGLPLTAKLLFLHPTVAQLAAAIPGDAAIGPRAEQGTITGPVSLTVDQSWFFSQDQLDRERRRWNTSALLETIPALKADRLRQALEYLVVQHDVLRARFHFDGTCWQQVIAPPGEPAPFGCIDLAGVPAPAFAAAIEASAEQLQVSVNLVDGPTFRLVYFDGGPARPGRLFLIAHHVVSDAQSQLILAEDLQRVYRQLSQGESVCLPPKTTSIKEWAERLRQYANSAALREEATYWRNLPWAQVPPLPLDYPERLAENNVASQRSVRVTLDPAEMQRLLQQANAHAVSVHDLLLMAVLETITDWTGGEWAELVVVDSGRSIIPDADDLDVSRTVGWLATSRHLILKRSELGEPEIRLSELQQQLRAIPNRGLGYGLLSFLNDDPEIVRQIRPLRKEQVLFNYLGRLGGVGQSPASLLIGPAAERAGLGVNPTDQQFLQLICTAGIQAGHLFADWTYSENLHRRATIERVAGRFLAVLRGFLDR